MFMDCPTTTAKLFPKCMNLEISFEAYSEKRERAENLNSPNIIEEAP